jgi:type VI secretion system protein ImpF
MTAVHPGLFDRLMGGGQAIPEHARDRVARDLEALLNTRAGTAPEAFDDYPEARASILNYGLLDLAAFSLSSSEDRAAICASLKDVIERHEPRLRNVSAVLEQEAVSVNRLSFVIHATLQIAGAAQAVDFNAVLQPSSLHYSISLTQRTRRWTST